VGQFLRLWFFKEGFSVLGRSFPFPSLIGIFPSFCQALAEDRVTTPTKKKKKNIYGRSPDRSARVCNLRENGDYIQNEKHVIYLCMGTEHLRHQFNHLFDHISEGDIKGFVFQHN